MFDDLPTDMATMRDHVDRQIASRRARLADGREVRVDVGGVPVVRRFRTEAEATAFAARLSPVPLAA